MSLLDVGCGPGTITCDLARQVAPGQVVGIDRSTSVIVGGPGRRQPAPSPPIEFEAGDVFDLAFEDATSMWSTPIRCSNTWATRWPPWSRCAGMPARGGLVAAATVTTPAIRYYPDDPSSTGPSPPTGQLTRANGAHWDAGRRLLAWAHRAGFTEVVPSASTWCFATPEDRAWWGGLWAERFTQSALAEQLTDHTPSPLPADLVAFAAAWRRWAASPDGWFVAVHGEVLCIILATTLTTDEGSRRVSTDLVF
jgi:SAM-dependent methyltransferase